MTMGGTVRGSRPLVWSAATCDFRGAGAYIGLAPDYEHIAAARGLGAKQANLYVGGRMRSGGEARPWPINYYAIRDPSAIRVIPVSKPVLPNGFRPVHLRFNFPEHNGRTTVIVAPPGEGRQDREALPHASAAPMGFVVTIGLPIEREADFFGKIIEHHLDQEWAEVFQRVHDYGCRGAA
jgi:hypothetical protein